MRENFEGARLWESQKDREMTICPHGVSFDTFCERCLKESKKGQPAWRTIERLQSASRFTRSSMSRPTCEIKIGEKLFTIEHVEGSENPTLGEVQKLFETTFGLEEVDPEEILRNAVEGKTPFGTIDETRYRVYAIKNQEGKVVSVLTGGVLELKDKKESPTGEVIFMVAYAVTDKNIRQGGLAREAYISALIGATAEAQSRGRKLAFVAGEAKFKSEAFWNKVGWKRVYAKSGEDDYTEIPYIQPPLDFNPKTGLPSENAGEAPEHIMIDPLDQKPPTKEQLLATIRAFYRWNHRNPWPRGAFESNQAFETQQRGIDQLQESAEGFLRSHGTLIFLDQSSRDKARARFNLEIHDHSAADYGDVGGEDF